jgi:hypothetical protein
MSVNASLGGLQFASAGGNKSFQKRLGQFTSSMCICPHLALARPPRPEGEAHVEPHGGEGCSRSLVSLRVRLLFHFIRQDRQFELLGMTNHRDLRFRTDLFCYE